MVGVDEPDRSLDAMAQCTLWEALFQHKTNYQIILAVHSLAAFSLEIHKVPGVHVVEMEKGYASKVQVEYDVLRYLLRRNKNPKEQTK